MKYNQDETVKSGYERLKPSADNLKTLNQMRVRHCYVTPTLLYVHQARIEGTNLFIRNFRDQLASFVRVNMVNEDRSQAHFLWQPLLLGWVHQITS